MSALPLDSRHIMKTGLEGLTRGQEGVREERGHQGHSSGIVSPRRGLHLSSNCRKGPEAVKFGVHNREKAQRSGKERTGSGSRMDPSIERWIQHQHSVDPARA